MVKDSEIYQILEFIYKKCHFLALFLVAQIRML